MKTIGVILLAAAQFVCGQNLIQNGGFEEGLTSWSFGAVNNAQATGVIDSTVAHTGKGSFKMTNASPAAPNVYGGLAQTVSGLTPNTEYRVSLWAKGKNVGAAWFPGGPRWDLRQALPNGTYDWTQVSFTYKTGLREITFPFRVNIDSVTEALWIDDIEFAPVGPPGPPAVTVDKGLSSAERIYPVMPDGKIEQAPAVRVMNANATFGGEVRLAWNAQGFVLDTTVVDSTPGPVGEGTGMWQTDCIQVSIDTQPEKPKLGYTETCFEFGFALNAKNEVVHHAWQIGTQTEFDWSNVREKGERTKTGYHLTILFPWKSLELNPKRLPRQLGVNVLFNNGEGGRSYLEWTPGTGETKDPKQYVRAILVAPDQHASVAGISLNPLTYEKDEWVVAQYVEYAVGDLAEENATLVGREKDGQGAPVDLSRVTLPKIQAGQRRTTEFYFPAAKLEREGDYVLLVSVNDAPKASASLVRTNVKPMIQAKVEKIKSQLDEVRKTLASNPDMAKDNYVVLGVTIAEKFLDRIQNHSQSPDWSLLQAEETLWVLERTRQQMATNSPILITRPTFGPVTVRDGVFYVDGKPWYFGGYGHFAAVERDIPVFWNYGVTIIQRERGPSALNPDFTLSDYAKEVRPMLQKAAANQIKVEMLLAPHYFPVWAPTLDPDDKPTVNAGFIQYNLDHPNARKVIQKWLEAFIPFIKDEPALFSVCLSNEPTYGNSGRDKHSRPLWIAYLKDTHKTIDALNALYQTKYSTFEEVPVPKIDWPEGANVHVLRAYYDWIIFNQQHFADWHAWMNGIVKKAAPNILTHAKVMNTIFERGALAYGTDPELFCRITDLAGNDAHAYLAGEGPFTYSWTVEQVWYDLLHSFRGAPVFNSENHLIPDGTPAVHLPPEHTYSVFWQGALHHLGATTTWVWEEPENVSLVGNIYLRPANTYAAGKAWLDLARLAPEVAAINQDSPKIALLYAVPSIFWEKDYGQVVQDTYANLAFLGQPVTFISERQLAEGTGPKVDFIVVPHATHVKSETVRRLNEFVQRGGKVIAVGDQCLEFDEYARPQSTRVTNVTSVKFGKHKALFDNLRRALAAGGLKRTILLDASSKLPSGILARSEVWGVEYRNVVHHGRTLVPMINMIRTPLTVKLTIAGEATDLISGEKLNLSSIRLEPMRPRLLQITSSGH